MSFSKEEEEEAFKETIRSDIRWMKWACGVNLALTLMLVAKHL